MPEHYGRVKQTAETMSRPYEGEYAVVAEARARCYESWSASQKFRLQRDDDRAFMQDQYDVKDRRARTAREVPSLQVHTVAQRIQSVMEDFRRADVGFRVGAAAGGAGEEVSAIYNGLAQADMRDVRSQAAMAKAMQECATYGMAWLQWMAVPVSVANPFDQRLVLRAPNNEQVYEDPYDDTREKSDIDWLIEVERMTVSRRDARWPRNKGTEPVNFESLSTQNDWWFPSGSVGPDIDREVRVAYYYKRRYEEAELAVMPGWEKPRLLKSEEQARSQADIETRMMVATGMAAVMKTQMPYVEFCVLDGASPITEPARLPYSRIPYARLLGQVEIANDEEEVPRGITYYLKDMARWMSLTASDILQKQMFGSADCFLVANEGDAGELEDPKRPGTKHYNAFIKGPDGKLVPVPPPQYHSTNPAIESGIATVQVIRELQAVATGAADAPMREDTARVSSVQVLDRMDRHQAVGRGTYVWWFSNVVMQLLSDLWLDMSQAVYGRAGRVVRVAGESMTDDDQGAIVGMPFYRDDHGNPVVVEVGDDVDRIPNPEAPDDPDLSYKVIRFTPQSDRVKVTPYTGITETSGTDAALEVMNAAVQANPALGPAMAVPFVKAAAQRYPVLHEAVERAEAISPEPVSRDMSAKDAYRLVSQLKREIAEKDQQLELATQAADQVQGAKDIEGMRAQSKELIAQMQDAFNRFKVTLDSETKLRLAGHQQAHEEGMQDDRQAHEAAMEGAKIGNANQQAALDRKAAAAKPKEKTRGGQRK